MYVLKNKSQALTLHNALVFHVIHEDKYRRRLLTDNNMGPKKGKDLTNDENYWRLCIEEAPLDEESWKVKVIMIEAAGSDQDGLYLNKFETYAAKERRFVIKNICKTETIFMINQLGGEKKVKDDSLRVFEEGQGYLKEKTDIPPEIMALVIKNLILKMKEEYLYIKRQKLEVREGMKRESVTMISNAEIRGTVVVKIPEPDPQPLPPKGKATEQQSEKPIELEEDKKYNTLLRVRGEEWRDKIYIDDFPEDGPNLYVAVTGFLDPNLAGCLIKIGIPLTAVVQIRIDPTVTFIPPSLSRTTKRGHSQTELLTDKTINFWKDLQQLRIDKSTADDFKDTAFVVFSPPYWADEKLSECDEKIYDEICYLMYDVHDLTRQHIHYLNNMDIITIPLDDKTDLYQDYYLPKVKDIPLESITTYSVLHAILLAVCEESALLNDNNGTLSTSHMTSPTFSKSPEEQRQIYKSEELVREFMNNLGKIESIKNKYRVTCGQEYESFKDPIIINHGDFLKFKTFHLKDINLDNGVYAVLSGMPFNKLWNAREKPLEEEQAKINFHLNLLVSCFDRFDIEKIELKRLLNILACRKVYNNRSALKKEHLLPCTKEEFKKKYLKRSILAEPLIKSSLYACKNSDLSSLHSISLEIQKSTDSSILDSDEDLKIKYLFECPDISELASASEITNQKPLNHMIESFEYFEDFKDIEALQVMLNAFNQFNCVDYKYCEVTDCFILMFYNNHDNIGMAREEWRCHLPTYLCLQDFFDFVLEEHYDWIKREEMIYDENIKMKTQLGEKESKNQVLEKSCVENTDVENELLMEGSLKYNQMKEIRDDTSETSISKILSSNRSKTPISKVNLDSKNVKNTKSVCSVVEEKTEIMKKPFSAYDLSDRRVEFFGKDSSFFSEDGTRISTLYSLLIPMNLEYVTLNVTNNNLIKFWMHKALGETAASNAADSCESFRIEAKDDLIIYIKKQLYTIRTCLEEETITKNLNDKNLSPNIIKSDTQVLEYKPFYSLVLTWPTGLVTESIYENNSQKISHIKQHYLSKIDNLNEDMRCISLNGEVIIFDESGDIEILKPDGTYYRVTKYEKRMINEADSEEARSTTSSDKSKKGTEKDKHKAIKTPLKSPKKNVEDDENLLKPKEYELYIEEFEIIENNGLKEKWINNEKVNTEKVLIKTATDYCLGEVFSKRMDGTNILLNKDGVLVVTFPNNTRITTSFIIEEADIFPEWTEEEIEYLSMFEAKLESDTVQRKGSESPKSFSSLYRRGSRIINSKSLVETNSMGSRKDGYVSVYLTYSIEHFHFTTVIINKDNDTICIESPSNTRVIIDSYNNYEFVLNTVTSATFNGQYLNLNHTTCTECESRNNCEVKICSELDNASDIKMHWLKMSDAVGKCVIVDKDGNIDIPQDSHSSLHNNGFKTSETSSLLPDNEHIESLKSLSGSKTSHTSCKEMLLANSFKFFVLTRELSCSELIHRALVEKYKQDCLQRIWCSINEYHTLGDYRSLWSVLAPIDITESEKWLMESKFCDKPKSMTFKDLEIDTGKGFYHWMRPYKRFKPKSIKPNPVLPKRLPRAFILRVLEQQWPENKREQLMGAKELVTAVLRYRNLLENESETLFNVPSRDLRSENEKNIDKIVQKIAHRVYKNIKVRLFEDISNRARLTITTEPQPPLEDISTEGTEESEETTAIKEIESADHTSPNLKRYWRRREEEYNEEQFYKYLLREDNVPPYFQNVLAGGIWWEVNKAVDDAIGKVERLPMKCSCDEE